ncbi:MAG: 4Fe-4S binding protein [Candidatus Woesearchaeota archaeon]|jgi:polyferredoxin|nr:4Fe-4S binding protein [Candidatus Woesearchaeota archaeon]MDP7506659.1 4Fe-4S binding protein [Candidatus Woesearchaeota archaeon]|tara:strand:- start:440 stop:1150 length:711 start_codon:yes stop_codon:yes gene_type:complete
MKKPKILLSLTVSLILITILGYYALQENIRKYLSFFWSNDYYFIVYFSLIAAFVIIFLKLFKKFNVKNNVLKIIYGLIFLPAVVLPLFKCYFKVPYILCRACPKKCPWGELVPFIVPSFLVLNLDRRFWCFKLCPFGTLQDYQSKVSKKRIKLPGWLKNLRYLVLLFTAIVVLSLIFKPDFYFGLFIGTYEFYLITALVSLVIFILAFFIPRLWCNYFCPIGCVGDLALKAESKIR